MRKTVKLPDKVHSRNTMGGVQVHCTYHFDDGSSQRMTGYGKDEKQAREKMLDKIQRKADEINSGIAYETGMMTVQALIIAYMQGERDGEIKSRKTGKVKAVTSCDAADRRLKSLVLPYKPLMTKKISQLTVRDCLQYREWLDKQEYGKKGKEKPYNADTLNKSIAIVDRAISPYFKRLGENNPLDSVDRFIVHTKRKTEEDILTEEELKAFIQYCQEDITDHNRMQGLLHVYVYCREGELLGLKVKDFIPEKHILQIRRRVYRDKHGRALLGADGELKNESAYRDIAVCGQAYDLLLTLCNGKKPDDLIFSTDGKPINPRHYQRWFDRTKKVLGISEDRKLPVYNLRATGISFALACDPSQLDGISANAGHSDVKTTLKYYKASYFKKNVSAADSMTIALKALMNTVNTVCIEG